MSTAVELPHWDMTVIFPSLESDEYKRSVQQAVADIKSLVDLFDRYNVAKQESVRVDDRTIEAFGAIVGRFNALLEELLTLRAYVTSFVTTDTRDDVAQAELSTLEREMIPVSQLQTRLTAWIGSMDVEALIARSEPARAIAFTLRKAKTQAEHLMPQGEEDLASELGLSGGTAWEKLHDNITSQLIVPLEIDGELEELPMSVVRNMAYEADGDLRRRAYEAELAAWERVGVPCAAALNSIKGQTNTLDKRRGWESSLDVALFNNNIDRPTLDAMMDAARASFPHFRRYLRAKARALGEDSLPWFDLFAPVGSSEQVWDWDAARDFLLEQFGTYSDRLRDFAARAYGERWIDAEPRPGKEDGAFCMSVRPGESRVLTNYQASYRGMSTLAHELGHAYHNFNLVNRSVLQRSTPMILAETASIFCETIVRSAALQRANREEQLSILDASLENACQVVVDITSRFLFEKGVFEARLKRELSVDELNNLMLDTQRDTYGDGLDQAFLHPYMWAVKGHYYYHERPYYNFPYMFGLLFGLGLYAQYQENPDEFKRGYDRLLSSTGMADAATLANEFGINIRQPDFWRSSLDLVRDDVDRFERLVDGS